MVLYHEELCLTSGELEGSNRGQCHLKEYGLNDMQDMAIVYIMHQYRKPYYRYPVVSTYLTADSIIFCMASLQPGGGGG